MQDDVPRPLARVLAALLALLLTLEASGIAFALDAGPLVECCCGEHAIEHPCGCPDCPGSRHDSDTSASESSMSSHLGSCQRTERARLVPATPMLPPAEPLVLVPPAASGDPVHLALLALVDHRPSPSRPPP